MKKIFYFEKSLHFLVIIFYLSIYFEYFKLIIGDLFFYYFIKIKKKILFKKKFKKINIFYI